MTNENKIVKLVIVCPFCKHNWKLKIKKEGMNSIETFMVIELIKNRELTCENCGNEYKIARNIDYNKISI